MTKSPIYDLGTINGIYNTCEMLAELLKGAIVAISPRGVNEPAKFTVPYFWYCEGLTIRLQFVSDFDDIYLKMENMAPFLDKVKELNGHTSPNYIEKGFKSYNIEVNFSDC